MHEVANTIPISQLRSNQIEILKQLDSGPVLLTKQGKAVAMLVSPTEWNRLIDTVEDLHLALDAMELHKDPAPTTNLVDYLAARKR